METDSVRKEWWCVDPRHGDPCPENRDGVAMAGNRSGACDACLDECAPEYRGFCGTLAEAEMQLAANQNAESATVLPKHCGHPEMRIGEEGCSNCPDCGYTPMLTVDGEPCSLADFLDNNAEDHAADLREAVCKLQPGDVYIAGGGAAATFQIARVS